MRKVFLYFNSVIVLCLILTYDGNAQDISKISTPQKISDGWSIGSLKEAGVDSVRLIYLLDRITEKEYPGIDAILIVKNGKLIFESYFMGHDFDYTSKDYNGKLIDYNYNTPHNLASITKSVTAILCGIAIDKQLIHNVNDKIYTFFPEYSSLFAGQKRDITLYNLLTMTSGLQWNEQDVLYGDSINDIVQLFRVPDPIRYILSKPLIHEPGTNFYYNGGSTELVGQIIQRSSGMKLNDFALKYLFDPMRINQPQWTYINRDFVYASGNLRLSPRDMAKLGSLVLNKGMWNDNRIVSSEWIEQMTHKQMTFPKGGGYGYQWWLVNLSNGFDSYHATGWGGQGIAVIPELDAVVIVTGSNYAGKSPNNDMMVNYVLPALSSDFNYDFETIEKESPLPDSLEMVAPAAGEISNLSGFSGHWGGQWVGQWNSKLLSCQLTVESVSRNEAVIVYSWADDPSGNFRNGWIREKAEIDSSGRLKFEAANSYDFRFDAKEDVLIGNMKSATAVSKIIMRRKNE